MELGNIFLKERRLIEKTNKQKTQRTYTARFCFYEVSRIGSHIKLVAAMSMRKGQGK